MTMAPLTGRRILIVDDNPFVSSLLQRGLMAEGCEASVAPDGLAALDTVAARHPDLILLDVDLPHVPGDEICRHLAFQPCRFAPLRRPDIADLRLGSYSGTRGG